MNAHNETDPESAEAVLPDIATLVHDLAQPLSAIANYLNVALYLIEARPQDSDTDGIKIHNAVTSALAEVYRASARAKQIRSATMQLASR